MAEAYQTDILRNRGDDTHTSGVVPAADARIILFNQVSWGAVLAGVVVSLVTQLILNMIGIGIGASNLNAGAGQNPSASGFSIGAGIWWTLAGVIAALVGGYVSGRLSGKPKNSTAGWQGLTTWALTTLVVFYLLTSAVGGVLGGAYRTVTGAIGGDASTAGGTMQTVAQAAGPSLSGVSDPFSSIEQSLKGATGGNDPAALRDSATVAMRAVVTGDEAKVQEAGERASQVIAKAQNIPIEQARAEVQQYAQQYREAVTQAKLKATQLANATATAVSRAALFGSVALILGAWAGWFGGRMGAVEPTVTTRGTHSSSSGTSSYGSTS